MEDGSTVDAARRVLEKYMLGWESKVPGGAFKTNLHDLKAWIELDAGRAIMKMRACVWKEVVQRDTAAVVVKYPADWWQAFKARFFPLWLLARYPVREAEVRREVKFEVAALLPGYKYVPPRDAGDDWLLTYDVIGGD